MDTFWERAAYLVHRMFSLYYVYLLFSFPHFGFEDGTLVVAAPVLGHCLPFNFLNEPRCEKTGLRVF